jgi:hypothetical protein
MRRSLTFDVPNILRLLAIGAVLLWMALDARAASRITATISITNAPTVPTQTLAINGDTRTWTNSVTLPASQIATNSTAAGSATNLWLHVLATPFAGPVTVQMVNATNLAFVGAIDQAMTVAAAGNWATVTLSTQTVSTLYTVRVPGSAEPAAVRATNYTLLTTALSDYSLLGVNESSNFATNLVGLTNAQTVGGAKTFTNASSRWLNGEVTNAELKSMRVRFDNTNANGIYFYSSAAGRISAIAPDANGLPSIYGTVTLEQPTNGLSYTPASENILTKGGADTTYGRLATANTWTGTNSFAQITNSFITGGSASNVTVFGSIFAGTINGATITTLTNATLPKTTSSSVGVINVGSMSFIHTYGGMSNLFMGEGAGNFTLTQGSNTVVGARAGEDLTDGRENAFFGFKAGMNATTARNSTLVGGWAGSTITTGDYNVMIGDSADVSSSSVTRAVAVGGANSVGNDSAVLGYSATATSYTNAVAIGANATATAHGTGAIGGTGTMGIRAHVNAGQAASARAYLGGVINRSSTQTGNGAGSETDLFSYTLPASTLVTDGEIIEFSIAGTYAANGNSKTINVKFGSTTIYTTGGLAINAGEWVIKGTIMRTGASAQKCWITAQSSDALLVSDAEYATASESTGSTIQLRVTGNGAGASDVVGEMWVVKWSATP